MDGSEFFDVQELFLKFYTSYNAWAVFLNQVPK